MASCGLGAHAGVIDIGFGFVGSGRRFGESMSSPAADSALEAPGQVCGSRSTTVAPALKMQAIREAIYEILHEIQRPRCAKSIIVRSAGRDRQDRGRV